MEPLCLRRLRRLAAFRAQNHAPCAAFGLAEPHPALSVSGRAAEPKNSVNAGACSHAVRRGAGSRGCGSAMSEGSSCAAPSIRIENRFGAAVSALDSTSRCLHGPRIRPENTTAIATISWLLRNHRCGSFCSDRCEIWLKSPELLPTFASDRDVAQILTGIAPDFEHIHAIARCPGGLSVSVRRTGSLPPALPKNP